MRKESDDFDRIIDESFVVLAYCFKFVNRIFLFLVPIVVRFLERVSGGKCNEKETC